MLFAHVATIVIKLILNAMRNIAGDENAPHSNKRCKLLCSKVPPNFVALQRFHTFKYVYYAFKNMIKDNFYANGNRKVRVGIVNGLLHGNPMLGDSVK